MTGQEGLCDGFKYTVQLLTRMGAVQLKEWVGKSVGITLDHDHDGEKHICGFIRRVKQLSDDESTEMAGYQQTRAVDQSPQTL